METKYTVVTRKEGNRMVFDVYDEGGRLWRKGLSLAGMQDTIAQMTEE